MQPVSRRRFLGLAAATGGALVLPSCASPVRRSANETIRVGVIGLRGRGNGLASELRAVKGVSIAALCDVDPAVLDKWTAEAKKRGESPFACSDARRIFDDRSIDAVAIATPNHTHAILTLWAMQAGKDVYVEKPVSHDLQEGRALVDAARRSGRIVQSGLQNRSDNGLIPAYGALHAGELGTISSVHGICYRDRKGIGRRATPITPPPGVDYELWLGPAQDLPILRESFHYDWHWCWNTGNGDIGNQAPHELDMVAWALREPGLPREVISIGGRYGWNDAGETPNVMTTFFRFASGVPVCFEVRNLVPNPRTGYRGLDSTGVVICTDRGELRAQRGGAVFVDREGKTTRTWKGDSGASHAANFVDAMRAGDRSLLRAEVERGHHAAAMAHLANASIRLARMGALHDALAASAQLPGFGEHLESMTKNLAGHGMDLRAPLLGIGATLSVDASTERCAGERATEANALLACERRKGYELPRVG